MYMKCWNRPRLLAGSCNGEVAHCALRLPPLPLECPATSLPPPLAASSLRRCEKSLCVNALPKRCAPEVLSSLRAQLWHRTGRAAALYETDVLARTDLLRGRTPVCLLAGMLRVDGERGARDDSARPYPGDGK